MFCQCFQYFVKIVVQLPMFCQCFQYFSMFLMLSMFCQDCRPAAANFGENGGVVQLLHHGSHESPSENGRRLIFFKLILTVTIKAIFHWLFLSISFSIQFKCIQCLNRNKCAKWDFQLLWNGRSPSGPRSCSSVSTTNNGSIRQSFPNSSVFSTSET